MYEDVVPFRGQRLGLVGAALVAVGSVTAWAAADPVVVAPTVEGLTAFESPRALLLVVAFLAWVVVLLRDWGWVEQFVVAAVGALVVGLAGRTFVALLGGSGQSPGFGIVVAVGGGALLLVGGGLDSVTE